MISSILSLFYFLQVEALPSLPGLMDKLANQGPTALLLIAAVVWLIKRDQKTDAKLDKYIEDDRQEMLNVIRENTAAFKEMTETLKQIKALQK